MGTQRYGKLVQAKRASSFVEDWISAPGDHCINSNTRTVRYHDISYRLKKGPWKNVKSAEVMANYLPGNNEICANYAYEATKKGFIVSSGGKDRISAPLIGTNAKLTLP